MDWKDIEEQRDIRLWNEYITERNKNITRNIFYFILPLVLLCLLLSQAPH